MPRTTDRKQELLRGTLDMMILRVLTIGPQHGYGITRRIEQQSGGVLSIEEGSLYPALHRLHKRGWVSAEWKASENNRRAKYYKLTADGKAALKRETDAWAGVSAAVNRVLDAPIGGETT